VRLNDNFRGRGRDYGAVIRVQGAERRPKSRPEGPPRADLANHTSDLATLEETLTAPARASVELIPLPVR
jgi:hypothetical protein